MPAHPPPDIPAALLAGQQLHAATEMVRLLKLAAVRHLPPLLWTVTASEASLIGSADGFPDPAAVVMAWADALGATGKVTTSGGFVAVRVQAGHRGCVSVTVLGTAGEQ